MKTEEIKDLLGRFEAIACEYEGVECWSARELYPILGYAKWQTFERVLEKAREACIQAGVEPSDHFTGVSKTIAMPKGASKEIEDIMLTRYACYLVAQNGDPRKPEIAFAQNYFAVQTRVAEVVEKRMLEFERVQADTNWPKRRSVFRASFTSVGLMTRASELFAARAIRLCSA